MIIAFLWIISRTESVFFKDIEVLRGCIRGEAACRISCVMLPRTEAFFLLCRFEVGLFTAKQSTAGQDKVDCLCAVQNSTEATAFAHGNRTEKAPSMIQGFT